MSKVNDIRRALSKYFKDNWSRDENIAWPNKAYRPVKDKAFLRFYIRENQTIRVLMTGDSNDGEEYSGTIFIQVYTPSNTGDLLSGQLVDAVADLLKEKEILLTGSVEPINTQQATPNTVGNTGDGWYLVNVAVPFKHLNIT